MADLGGEEGSLNKAVGLKHNTKADSHDGLEVVIHQDHVCSFLAHVGTRLAHCNADVGSFEGHGVIDAVAGHGHHSTDVLQRLQATTTFTGRSQFSHPAEGRRELMFTINRLHLADGTAKH